MSPQHLFVPLGDILGGYMYFSSSTTFYNHHLDSPHMSRAGPHCFTFEYNAYTDSELKEDESAVYIRDIRTSETLWQNTGKEFASKILISVFN